MSLSKKRFVYVCKLKIITSWMSHFELGRADDVRCAKLVAVELAVRYVLLSKKALALQTKKATASSKRPFVVEGYRSVLVFPMTSNKTRPTSNITISVLVQGSPRALEKKEVFHDLPPC